MKHPAEMANAGFCLANGLGVKENVFYGASLVSVAVGMGSDAACYYLGEWHFEGENILPKDKSEAKHWLTKTVDSSCSMKHLDDTGKEEPRKWLDELEEWL